MQLINKFFTVPCCSSLQMVDPLMMEKANEITCCDCGEVIAMCGTNGVWYFVGGRVFKDDQ